MRKVLIILWLVLLFLQNFSVKAQNLTDIECTTAWAYDFWGRSDNDKDIYVHYQNVNIEPLKTIPINLVYSYDYKNRVIRVLANNSNSYMCCLKVQIKK